MAGTHDYKAVFLDWDDTIGDWMTATYIVPKLTDIMNLL